MRHARKHPTLWGALGFLILVAIGAVLGLAAPHAPAKPRSPQSFEVHHLEPALTGAQAKRPPAGANAYGWTWDHPVAVYDGTGNPRWDVAGAVDQWDLAGLDVYLTSDPANADVTVTEGDAISMCGVTVPIIGCADTTVVGGEPVSARIVMQSGFGRADSYWQCQHGGTLHELGHTVGFGHAATSNDYSVMGAPIPCNQLARTSLSTLDRKGVVAVYGR